MCHVIFTTYHLVQELPIYEYLQIFDDSSYHEKDTKRVQKLAKKRNVSVQNREVCYAPSPVWKMSWSGPGPDSLLLFHYWHIVERKHCVRKHDKSYAGSEIVRLIQKILGHQ